MSTQNKKRFEVVGKGRRRVDGRAKALGQLRFADDMALLCAAKGALFIVNDRVESARLVGAQGVHLGQEDFFDAGHTHAAQVIPSSSSAASRAPSPGSRVSARSTRLTQDAQVMPWTATTTVSRGTP